MTDLVRNVTFGKAKLKELETFNTGDTINVHVKVKEGEKERIQVFKGIVTKIQGSGMGKSFTVRKMSSGVGVERTFPFASPMVDKVDIISYGIIRRSRLFYLRDRQGKAAKVESELAVMRKSKEKAKQKS